MEPDELRRRASRYRDLASRMIDPRAVEALRELADEYEARAEDAQVHPRALISIRTRAAARAAGVAKRRRTYVDARLLKGRKPCPRTKAVQR